MNAAYLFGEPVEKSEIAGLAITISNIQQLSFV